MNSSTRSYSVGMVTSPVYLEFIDLLVFELDRANECSGTAQLSRCHAQAVARGQRLVLGKP
jgi:hypothetical protein